MKRILSLCNKILGQAENISIGIALLGATFMVTVNVINRFVFKNAFAWSDELVRYLMIYVTFIGCAGCVRKKQHIAIDIIASVSKNKKLLRVLDIIIGVICTVFSAAITIYAIQLVQKTHNFPQLTAGLRVPQYIPYLMIPIGFALMTLRYVQDTVGKIIGVDIFAADHQNLDVPEEEEGGEA